MGLFARLAALAAASVLSCQPPAPTQPVAAGASSVPAATRAPAAGACPGAIAIPPGFSEVGDAKARKELLDNAIGQPDKGGLCAAKAVVAAQPTTVYRVWNKAKAYTKTGVWWTFDAPRLTKDKYREVYEICPEFSPLDSVVKCRLKAGVPVAIGTGQSVQCEKGISYPTSTELQVYIPNDTRDPANQKVYVEECSEEPPLPEK